MFKRDLDYVIKDLTLMENFLSRRDVKYRRNYNRYYNNGNRSEDIFNLYGNAVGYFNQYESQGNIPYLNVLRSCVESTVSKLSQTKVRPFFTPINGTYKTSKVCRNSQIYFDEFFDKQNIYHKLTESVRDALIFDMGVVWVDDASKTIKQIKPWEFYYDAGEFSNKDLTRCALIRRQYPLISLRDIIAKDSVYYTSLETTPNAYVKYKIYYDLIGKKKYQFIENDLIKEEKIVFEEAPFVWIFYNNPLKGSFSDSMIDSIYPQQRMLDEITYKVAQAVKLSPANTIFIPKGSDIKTSVYASSKIGDVFEYNIQGSGSTNPVTVSTPPAIDNQYLTLMDKFENSMYNMTGVSQLSAQSKKPNGLNSGVALQTLEDVESERHNVLLGDYIRFAKDLAERVIDVYPDNEDILPNRQARSNIKWKDIKKEREMFNIQFSATSSLSKDPQIKMEQIEKLLSMGVIDPNLASTLLEMPDLEGAYSISTASYNSNEKTIERVIEEGPNPDTGTYSFYEVTDVKTLYKQAVNTLLRLDTSDEVPDVLNRLTAFIVQLKGYIDKLDVLANPPMPPAPEPLPPPPPEPIPVTVQNM